MIINLLKYSSILSFYLLIGCDSEVKTNSIETTVVEDRPSIVLISKNNNGHIETGEEIMNSFRLK